MSRIGGISWTDWSIVLIESLDCDFCLAAVKEEERTAKETGCCEIEYDMILSTGDCLW